jgi:hypothetical protein
MRIAVEARSSAMIFRAWVSPGGSPPAVNVEHELREPVPADGVVGHERARVAVLD